MGLWSWLGVSNMGAAWVVVSGTRMGRGSLLSPPSPARHPTRGHSTWPGLRNSTLSQTISSVQGRTQSCPRLPLATSGACYSRALGADGAAVVGSQEVQHSLPHQPSCPRPGVLPGNVRLALGHGRARRHMPLPARGLGPPHEELALAGNLSPAGLLFLFPEAAPRGSESGSEGTVPTLRGERRSREVGPVPVALQSQD